MTNTSMIVRFGTVDGQATQRTVTGDFGFVPSENLLIDFGQGITVTVSRCRVQAGGAQAQAIANSSLQADLPAAQALLTALTNRAQALGFTVGP